MFRSSRSEDERVAAMLDGSVEPASEQDRALLRAAGALAARPAQSAARREATKRRLLAEARRAQQGAPAKLATTEPPVTAVHVLAVEDNELGRLLMADVEPVTRERAEEAAYLLAELDAARERRSPRWT